MLYCVKLTDGSGDFDLAAEMLAALELDFSSWEDRENREIIHLVYADTPEQADENLRRIEEAIKDWSSFGVEITGIERVNLKREDWAESWKLHFKVLEISDRLFIKPTWLDVPAKEGRAIVELDPGMSFGTGQHATTYYCLKVIDRFADDPKVKSVLDAGCGSGILAIAAAKLNYAPVDAFDYDSEAVRITEENLELNSVAGITPETADAANYPGRAGGYDLACANILGHLLKAYRYNIASWVKKGGYLALAGILSTEFDGVSEAFQELGFKELDRETLREWTSGLFQKKK